MKINAFSLISVVHNERVLMEVKDKVKRVPQGGSAGAAKCGRAFLSGVQNVL